MRRRGRRQLKKRLSEAGRGKLIGPSEQRVTFEAMAGDLHTDCRANGKRSIESARFSVNRLRASSASIAHFSEERSQTKLGLRSRGTEADLLFVPAVGPSVSEAKPDFRRTPICPTISAEVHARHIPGSRRPGGHREREELRSGARSRRDSSARLRFFRRSRRRRLNRSRNARVTASVFVSPVTRASSAASSSVSELRMLRAIFHYSPSTIYTVASAYSRSSFVSADLSSPTTGTVPVFAGKGGLFWAVSGLPEIPEDP